MRQTNKEVWASSNFVNHNDIGKAGIDDNTYCRQQNLLTICDCLVQYIHIDRFDLMWFLFHFFYQYLIQLDRIRRTVSSEILQNLTLL
jgi:hypothetical protein